MTSQLLIPIRKNAVFASILLPIMGHALQSAQAAPKASPKIVKKELTITCAVTPLSKNGVVLAQGGSVRGYVVYLKGGKPIFSVRQNGKIYNAAAKVSPKGRFLVEAKLAKDGKMSLAINGKVTATGKAPGLFAIQPKDELSTGKDTMSAVGEYKAPNPLQGKIENVKVVTK
jgi:hypothetical protein